MLGSPLSKVIQFKGKSGSIFSIIDLGGQTSIKKNNLKSSLFKVKMSKTESMTGLRVIIYLK